MEAFLDQVVFSVAGKDYRWADVVAAAQAWGDWSVLRDRAREGLACLARFDEEEDDGGFDQVIESAADEFRYARDLVSAQEMEDWLGRWGLTAEDWMEWVRCSTLRRKWSDELADTVSRYAPGDEDLESFTSTEAICSGALERLAFRLAARAAIASRDGSASAADPEKVESSFEEFRRRVLTPAAIETEIRLRRSDWTTLECRVLSFGEEGPAREAALCVREEGAGFDEVAARAGLLAESETFRLGDIEPDLRDFLIPAKPGEVLGPFRRDGEFVLFEVLDRTAPSEGDSSAVSLAEESILDRLMRREVDESVRWSVAPRTGP